MQVTILYPTALSCRFDLISKVHINKQRQNDFNQEWKNDLNRHNA